MEMALQMNPYGGAAVASFPLRQSDSLIPFHYRPSFQPSRRVVRLVALSVVKRNPKRLKYNAPLFPKNDELLYVEVDPNGADTWKLDPAVELLKMGAVGVIPTDTVYAMVCDMNNHDAIERLRRLKDVEPSKPFSLLCRSFNDIDTYTTGFPRGNSEGLSNTFRFVKHCLPGPYTFILSANKALPKQCVKYGTSRSRYASRKSVGVRIPSDPVCQAVLEKMGGPLISTSVRTPQEDEWIIDPVIIADTYGPKGLDFIIAAGVRMADPSTVVDMTGNLPTIIRQGKGPKQPWMVEEEKAAKE